MQFKLLAFVSLLTMAVAAPLNGEFNAETMKSNGLQTIFIC